MSEKTPEQVIGRQLELRFVWSGSSPGSFEDPFVIDVMTRLEAAVKEVDRDGRKLKMVPASFIYDLLKPKDGKFRRWWPKTVEARNFKVGRDFICCPKTGQQRNSRGGHNAKDYLLPLSKAKEVIGTDSGPIGKVVIRNLFLLEQKFRDADPGMLLDMIGRQTNPELLASIADVSDRRAVEIFLSRGKSVEWCDEWLKTRREGRNDRILFTAAAKDHGVSAPTHFAGLTNTEYKVLFGKTANDMREDFDLKPRETPRSRLDIGQNLEVALTEYRAVEAMKHRNAKGYVQVRSLTTEVAQRVADSRLPAAC